MYTLNICEEGHETEKPAKRVKSSINLSKGNHKSASVCKSGSYSRRRKPGARFSKVPIINGPGKLFPFTLKIEVSTVLHLT